MQLMPFAAPPSTLRRRAAGMIAALVALASPALALAETGSPLPQGYTGDVNAAPQQAPAAQPANYPDADDAQDSQAQQPAQDAQAADGYADDDPSALTDFQQPLAGYGSWVQDPTYGTIWVPDSSQVGADFAPYQSAGQWAVDDGGDWMWQSDYAWGYIPFHYGRWVWAGSYWGWIPGRTYAPAWVSWRVGPGGYLGWAPLGPTWYWGPGGYARRLGFAPMSAYCFVPTGYAFAHGVGAYVVHDRGQIAAAAAGTRVYSPATPTVGHGPSHPGTLGRAYPRSPSLAEAHVPASAVPRAHADARAMSYATHSATLAQHASVGRYTTYDGFGRARSGPSLRTPSGGESFREGGSSYSSYSRGGSSFHASVPSGQRFVAPGGTRYRAFSGSRAAPRSMGHFSAPHFSGGGHRR